MKYNTLRAEGAQAEKEGKSAANLGLARFMNIDDPAASGSEKGVGMGLPSSPSIATPGINPQSLSDAREGLDMSKYQTPEGLDVKGLGESLKGILGG